MRRFAEEFDTEVEVDSAGTHGYHVGDFPDARMRAAAEQRGYDLDSQARQVSVADLQPDCFDLVLAMDAENHRTLVEMAGGLQNHIRMFSDYLDDTWPTDVPDPYYGEEEGFDDVLDILEEGCPVILQTITGEDLFADEIDETL